MWWRDPGLSPWDCGREGAVTSANSRSGSRSWEGGSGNVRVEWPGDSIFSSYLSLASAIVLAFVSIASLINLNFFFQRRLESGVMWISSGAHVLNMDSKLEKSRTGEYI